MCQTMDLLRLKERISGYTQKYFGSYAFLLYCCLHCKVSISRSTYLNPFLCKIHTLLTLIIKWRYVRAKRKRNFKAISKKFSVSKRLQDKYLIWIKVQTIKWFRWNIAGAIGLFLNITGAIAPVAPVLVNLR